MNIADSNKIMKYTIFKDNNGALEMAKTLKMRLRTKHIAIKYHHFCTYVEKGDILLENIDTAKQEVDFLTKPLVMKLFLLPQTKESFTKRHEIELSFDHK